MLLLITASKHAIVFGGNVPIAVAVILLLVAVVAAVLYTFGVKAVKGADTLGIALATSLVVLLWGVGNIAFR